AAGAYDEGVRLSWSPFQPKSQALVPGLGFWPDAAVQLTFAGWFDFGVRGVELEMEDAAGVVGRFESPRVGLAVVDDVEGVPTAPRSRHRLRRPVGARVALLVGRAP